MEAGEERSLRRVHEDGSALIYREGDRIVGGFWKACPLQAQIGSKCPHGHWTNGKKTEGAWKVGFRFTQRGYPDGKHVIRTQTGGAGSLVFRQGFIGTRTPATAAHGSKVLHLDEISGAPDLHLSTPS